MRRPRSDLASAQDGHCGCASLLSALRLMENLRAQNYGAQTLWFCAAVLGAVAAAFALLLGQIGLDFGCAQLPAFARGG